VTAAPLNNIDRVRADGSHYSVRSGEYASGGLPAVPGVIGAGRRPDGQQVLFGSRVGPMTQYSAARPQMTFPLPGGLDDAVAAAAWNPGLPARLALRWRCPAAARGHGAHPRRHRGHR
jgi:NADPH:quinone reductase-like Zn-dependent oxidoreductase